MNTTTILLFSSLLNLLLFSLVLAADNDDIRCLQGLKNTLTDPHLKLSSWNFSTITSVGAFTNFVGVFTSPLVQNRVFGIQLRSMELRGDIPDSLQFCRSLQYLDLSGNNLSTTIPSRICDWLPNLVGLDLSRNNLSGLIPPGLGSCKNLKNLYLENNHLSGPIPDQFSSLSHLVQLSLVSNNLFGQIPLFLSRFSSAVFEGNTGLCGLPLGTKCGKTKKKSFTIIIVAGVLGATVSLFGLAFWYWCFVRSRHLKEKIRTAKDDDTCWVERVKPHRLSEVSLFREPIVKIMFKDLLAATNNFNPGNILMSTRTGPLYKAVLADGSALAIKRLQTSKLNEKQFQSEMEILGELRHPNLVPLLGFCMVDDEKLLVYKHMPNGSLDLLLHGSGNTDRGQLDWPARLKIGIGTARGLAWLHHACEPPLVHQHISSNAILLDDEIDARITNFGLAKLLYRGHGLQVMFIHEEIGEYGYVAPEHLSTTVGSLKGDVYGFGVVLLELVTGQKPLGVSNIEEGFKGNLVDWINQLSVSGRIKEAIHQYLLGNGHDDEILQTMKIGCACVVSKPKDRPSMDQVYHSLMVIGEKHGFSEMFDEFSSGF